MGRLSGVLLAAGLLLAAGAAAAATVIVVQADGSVAVRVDEGPRLVVPGRCATGLRDRLASQSDPEQVELVVASVVRECAADDPALAGAIAAYAFTLVPADLAGAVVAGAQRGNPTASDQIETAAGGVNAPSARPTPVGLTTFGGVGGGGTQELRRGTSPTVR